MLSRTGPHTGSGSHRSAWGALQAGEVRGRGRALGRKQRPALAAVQERIPGAGRARVLVPPGTHVHVSTWTRHLAACPGVCAHESHASACSWLLQACPLLKPGLGPHAVLARLHGCTASAWAVTWQVGSPGARSGGADDKPPEVRPHCTCSMCAVCVRHRAEAAR